MFIAMNERVKRFFQETRQEWRHVNWPTRSEAIYLTAIVIGLSIALALFLGGFDYLFVSLLQLLVFRG